QNVVGLPERKAYLPPPVQGVDVFSTVRDRKKVPLAEHADVPVAGLHHAYLLGWYCTAGAHPEVIVKGIPAERFAAMSLPDRAEVVSLDESTVSIRLESHGGRWETTHRMSVLARSLGELLLDSEAHIELCTAKENDGSAGLLRLAGRA